MQPGNSQQGDSPPSGNRSSSLNLFFKKAFAVTKKEKAPDSSSATPEGDSSAGAGAGTQRTPKPHRNPTLTEVDLNNNVTALQTALTEAWPRRHHSRYKSGRALLVCWADGACASASTAASLNTRVRSNLDLGPMGLITGAKEMSSYRATPASIRMSASSSVRQDANQTPFISAARQLATVLERRYGIQSQVWMIPSLDNPQDMLVGKIKQFIDTYGGPDNLLVFWYGGNAEFVSTVPSEGAPGGDAAIAGELTWYGLYVSSLSFYASFPTSLPPALLP